MQYKSKQHKPRAPRAEELAVALPADYGWRILGKLALDLGHLLSDSENAELSYVVRNRDYDALLKLSEVWGPQCMFPVGTTPAVMHAKYQLSALLKKFRFLCDCAFR